MLRKALLIPVLGCLLMPAIAQAQFEQGDWSLTLGGTGNNTNDFEGVSFAVNGELGYFLTKELEVALRQSISFEDFSGSNLNGSTRVAIDYNFDLGRFVPYIGANIGYVYGDAVNDTFEAAPEGGVKFFVNSTTFIQLSVEYQFFFDKANEAKSAFSDGQFVYGLGIGFRF